MSSSELDLRRRIAHLDMDAFYASVELLRYPELKGKAVVIGGGRRHQPSEKDGRREFATLKDYLGRGVVTTATYEARAFGVHSGMGLMKAAALAPAAVLLPTDFDEYRKYSRLFKAAVKEIAPEVEDRGIDEIYVDVTAIPGDVRDIAFRIKERVRSATGLTCSIAITPNKLLSKICSDLDKPDGLTIVSTADIASRIWPLPARRISGIGPKANAKLEALEIHTIGELAAADPRLLIGQFGKNYGAWLYDAAHGRDDRPVVTFSEPKSISRETTFERDLHPVRDRDALREIFTALCVTLSADMTRKGYVGKTIGIKLRYDNFKTVTRDHTLEQATADALAIRRAAGECLKRTPLDRRLRLLGVRVGSLLRAGTDAGPQAQSAETSGHANLGLFD